MLIFLMMRIILSQMLKSKKDTRAANVRVFFYLKVLTLFDLLAIIKWGSLKTS